MDLSTIANVATALTVLIAVAFGVIEMRRARLEREERAAFAAVKAILSAEWMKSMIVVHSIPDGSTAAEIEADPRPGGGAFGRSDSRRPRLFRVCPHRSFACRRRSGRRHGPAGLAETESLRRRGTPSQRFAKKFESSPGSPRKPAGVPPGTT